MYRKWNSLEVFYVTTILLYDIISKTKQTRICMYQFFLPSFLACTFFYACVCLLHTFSFNDLVYVFFFVFTFIFIFVDCFCFCLFVFLIQVTLKSNHGKGVSGIRLIFTNLAMLVVAIWTKKNWSIHEVPHSSSGKYLHPWHGQLFFSTWDCHVLSCLSK